MSFSPGNFSIAGSYFCMDKMSSRCINFVVISVQMEKFLLPKGRYHFFTWTCHCIWNIFRLFWMSCASLSEEVKEKDSWEGDLKCVIATSHREHHWKVSAYDLYTYKFSCLISYILLFRVLYFLHLHLRYLFYTVICFSCVWYNTQKRQWVQWMCSQFY